MEVKYSNQAFFVKCLPTDNELMTRAGFSWDSKRKIFITPFSSVVKKVIGSLALSDILPEKEKLEIERKKLSSAVYSPIKVETNGPTPYGYQRAGIEYIVSNPYRATLLGDEMGCISGDEKVKINRGGCSREYSLEEVYQRFNKTWNSEIPSKIRAYKDGKIGLIEIKDVIYSGVKSVYEILLEDGKKVKATADHEVLTDKGWFRTADLLGKMVMVDNTKKWGKKLTKHTPNKRRYNLRRVGEFHPFAQKATIRGKEIKRASVHRLTYDAKINKVTLEELIQATYFDNDLKFLHPDVHVHHINGDHKDNSPENLEALTAKAHLAAHGADENRIGHGSPEYSKVLSVTYKGETDTYDLKCEAPYHNFVVNGMVVHNCGKTCQVILACDCLKVKRVLIICPASLKANWIKEWKLWSTSSLSIGVMDFTKDVVVINYDRLQEHKEEIQKVSWDLCAMDEAHYLKNSKAIRTKMVVGGMLQNKETKKRKKIYKIDAKHRVALTGTPIPNKPIELFTLLKFLLPSGFGSEWEYAKKFCGLYRDPRSGRFDMSGASNLDTLQDLLRSTIMVRRLKRDVLYQLPAKTRQVIEIDESGVGKLLKKEMDIFSNIMGEDATKLDDKSFDEVVRMMRDGSMAAFEDISTIRMELAVSKVPFVVSHLKDILEDGRKVVCFCVHKEVVKELKKSFGKVCVTLVGDTPDKKKQEAVDRFQNDDGIKLFIGNIKAAGVGHTLTSSSHVVFAELDWVPGNITQAEDRCHRIGQRENVLVQHLILQDSLESVMVKKIIEKQNIIELALDPRVDEELSKILA